MSQSDNISSDAIVETTETTTYGFDSGVLTSTGYVEIRENVVHLHFPEIPAEAEKPSCNYKSVQLFINNHLHFSFDWLPFYSIYDRVRIMDMVIKAYELFSNMIQGYFYSPFPHTNKSNYTYSSIITQLELKNRFKIYCLEDYVNTSIQITLCNQKENEDTTIKQSTLELPFHFQITIGNNYVFNSERDFKDFEQSHVNFLVQFILHKIIHMD